MTLDSLNSRLYYVDQHVVISDSPREDCVVMYHRHNAVDMEKAKGTLKKLGFKLNSALLKDQEGNFYNRLEGVS